MYLVHALWHAHTIYGRPLVAEETTNGTVDYSIDSPGGPSTAAIVGPGDQLWQQNLL